MPTINIQKEKLLVPSQIVELKKQDGKRIVKGFVADSSININGNGIKREAIDRIMQTMKDKPYLIPPFLDHPKAPNLSHDPEAHIKLIQDTAKPYEAGIVYDLERVNSVENPGYNAYIELTSDFAIKLFDEGILPRFMSMSLYKFNNNEPNTEITNAVINNICAVRNPAYGSKARILGMCIGDREECKTGLMESSVSDKEPAVFGTLTSSNPDGTVTVDITNKTGKCPTMQAVEGLSEEDTIRFDPSAIVEEGKEEDHNTTVDLNQEAQSSVEIQMSAQSLPGTIASETIVKYPRSKTYVKKDARGQVIKEGKLDDNNNPIEETAATTTTSEVKTEEVRKDSPTPSNEPKKEKEKEKEKEEIVQKEVKTKTKKGSTEEEEERPEDEEEDNEQAAKKLKEKQQETEPSSNQNNQSNSNDRIGSLEQQLKQLNNRVEKSEKTTKYYRRKIIERAVSGANWLKPEQKEERINRYEEMPLHGEDLELALADAFGPQMATVRSSSNNNNREKTSSVDANTPPQQYHEDNQEVTNSTTRKGNDGKLTLDLLNRPTRRNY